MGLKKSVADEAREFADEILAGIPALIDKSIEERRTEACWYEVYRKRRAARARSAVARRWWTWLAGISADKCAANKLIHRQCTAALRARGEGTA